MNEPSYFRPGFGPKVRQALAKAAAAKIARDQIKSENGEDWEKLQKCERAQDAVGRELIFIGRKYLNPQKTEKISWSILVEQELEGWIKWWKQSHGLEEPEKLNSEERMEAIAEAIRTEVRPGTLAIPIRPGGTPAFRKALEDEGIITFELKDLPPKIKRSLTRKDTTNGSLNE